MENQTYPVANALDNGIIMHRDAHFAGSFDAMLNYYRSGGKGVRQEFPIKRIEELKDIEEQNEQNLAVLLLSNAETEKIIAAKETYKQLKELYVKYKTKTYPVLLADLILSEEEEPQAQMNAIVAEKSAIVPALIELVQAEEYHDALYPGYGLAPMLAVKCLGRIGDKRAVIALFESIGQSDLFEEDVSLQALKQIGPQAKEFLLKVLHGRPLNEDNERAAIALIPFKDDPEVAKACFEMLQDQEVLKDLPLATYLVLACEGLQDSGCRKKFSELAENKALPAMLRQDMHAIIHSWN